MGFFGLFGGSADINSGVEEARGREGAKIIDVREPGEFAQGHIEGAVNVPLSNLAAGIAAAARKDEPLYVYCLSGARSSSACGQLQRMGYADVTDIGGINRWNGPIAR